MGRIVKSHTEDEQKKQAKDFVETIATNNRDGITIAKGAVVSSRVLNLDSQYINKKAVNRHRMLVAKVIEEKGKIK